MTSVFADQFYHTFNGEVFTESQCLIHEHSVSQLFYSVLLNLGYQSDDPYRSVWKKDNNTAVICLADDFTFRRTIMSSLPNQCFESNTVVITDNCPQFQPQYTVIRVPDSYFGIYNYVPAMSEFCPTKRFSFSVNRLDQQRELILLDLIAQSGGVDEWITLDYANFNCFHPYRSNESMVDPIKNFLAVWDTLAVDFPEYSVLVQQIQKHLPVRNHQLTVEQAHVSAYLTVVCETYAGDNNIVFSEKIFRALVTPAPWMLYGSRGAVKWLSNLGFDVLDNIVDHGYNQTVQDGSVNGIEKIKNFNASSISNYKELKKIRPSALKARCLKAAQHNQHLLTTLQQQWPQDFANWLPSVVDEIAGK